MIDVLEDEVQPDGAWRLEPPRVVAVLVLSDGARWIPAALDALAAQSHVPDELVVVDVGSSDGSADLVTARLPGHPVHNAPTGSGFGAAVQVGLDRAAPADWVWLLHDDCAPDADALACLLDEATRADDVAAVGPKVREWPSLRRLVEVGVTITGTGHRETGLERGEPDQGQHDRPRDVLAVGSAGMLVRRDAWDRLGGFDPGLPRYGDDVDFGWRANRAGLRVRVAPRAVVFHLEAASRSLREDGLPGSPVREQRRASLFTLLANASPAGFAWQSVRLVVGSVLRVLALLVAKAPTEARDELLGMLAVYRRPGEMFAARRRRAATAAVPPAAVRELLPSPAQPYQHGLDSLLDVVTALVRPVPAGSTGRRASSPGRRVQARGLDELGAEVPDDDRSLWARRPWLATVVVVVLAAIAAARGLVGGGSLVGGVLAASPESAGAWWSLFLSSSHDLGSGTSGSAPTFVLALAAPATLVWAHPGLVVDVLVLGAVPLAAATAHRLAVRLLGSARLQAWFALTWALGAVAVGATAQGRLGTLVAVVVAPVLVGAVLTMLETPGWQPAVRVAAWLSLATAFAPVAFWLTVPAVLVAALVRWSGRHLVPLVIVLLVPLAVVGPWTWERVLRPGTWWWEAGRADAGVGPLDPSVLDLLVGRAGGPGAAPAWFALGVVVAGLLALVRADRRAAVLSAWAVGLVGLALAVLGAGTRWDVPGTTASAPAWVGLPALVWAGALALAAALAVDGWRDARSRRGPDALGRVVPVVAVLALLGPVLTAGWWVVRGADDPLARGAATDVPAYLVDRAAAGEATLVLEGGRADGLGYQVLRGDGPRLGDESVPVDASRERATEAVVARLVSDPSPEAVTSLARRGISAVYLRAPADAAVASTLDSVAGLQPSGSPDPGSRVWTFAADVDVVQPEAPSSAWTAVGAWARLLVAAVVLVLALPGRRRRTR
ncbi:MAG: glycosyltransferase family 2 protein [Nocardioidaceae bacterium]|nr:glycosyltransferase family 2 protein [Nocardioidaceae bacterium]